MKGITFGTNHSYYDFSMILESKEIAAPKTKTVEIDIPGADGSLDLTDFFGEPKYENCTHKFNFSTIVPQSEFLTLYSNIKNAIHGKKMRIVLDDDPLFYYVGRCYVSSFTNEKNIGIISVEADCDPYKYRMASQSVNLCGVNLLNIDNGATTTPGAWTKTETGYTFARSSEVGGAFAYFSIPVKKGQQYIFSADYTLTTRLLYVYKNKIYGTLVAKESNGKPCVFTAEESGIYVFGLYVVGNTNDGVFENIMLKEGSEKGNYVPYDAEEKTVEATFSNLRKTAIPTVYVTNSMTVKKGTTVSTVTKGANVLPEFAFQQGDTALSFTGNGVAVVEWKEGIL